MGVGAQKGQGLGLAAVAGAEVLQRAVLDAELAAGDGDGALPIVGGLARYGVVVEVPTGSWTRGWPSSMRSVSSRRVQP